MIFINPVITEKDIDIIINEFETIQEEMSQSKTLSLEKTKNYKNEADLNTN
jgi:hypothetical protein